MSDFLGNGFLYEWLLLVAAQGLALMSPGPDFVMSVRNSLVYSRRAGFMTAAGFALGVGVHATYCIFGIATVITQSLLIFSIIKYLGAGYLIYIGFMALRSGGYNKTIEISGERQPMSDLAALRSGFITNLLNPKATLFFLALFTQIVDPHTPLMIQAFYGITCVVMTFIWFGFVTLVLTKPGIRAIFMRLTKWIDRLCGGLMIALGLKLAFAKVATSS